MIRFEPRNYPSGLQSLIANEREAELGLGSENQHAAGALASLDLDAAFAPHTVVDRSMAAACHSGLWLLHGFLDASHTISQNIDNATGSFWHGIMHRREGDFSNAKYWFRRVGEHPVSKPLAVAAHQVAADEFPNATDWDPFAFVDLCEATVNRRAGNALALRRVARLEWELLFDFCYRQAVGA